MSCAETRGRTHRHPHCGDCSQCIDRRFAVLAAGAEGFDPEGGYEIDLLTGPREDGPSRTLLASYLDTTNRIGGMTPDQFVARYGEVGRALRYMQGTPREALAEVFRLYQRHAGQVNGVVDRELARAGTEGRFRDGSLAPDCLIRFMSSAPVPTDRVPVPVEADNLFVLRGQAYRVRFQGGVENILLPNKGAAYLRVLLSRPGSSTSAADLASEVARRRGELGIGDPGKRADKEAVMAYRVKADELRADIEQAKRDNDLAAEQQAQRDLEFILAEIKRCTGVGGKLKDATNDRDKLRRAVGNAIDRTIAAIGEFDEALSHHLDRHIRRGNDPVYTPGGLDWFT